MGFIGCLLSTGSNDGTCSQKCPDGNVRNNETVYGDRCTYRQHRYSNDKRCCRTGGMVGLYWYNISILYPFKRASPKLNFNWGDWCFSDQNNLTVTLIYGCPECTWSLSFRANSSACTMILKRHVVIHKDTMILTNRRYKASLVH